MAVLGVGIGATMQNLVLAVQNNASHADMGAASSFVAFFRSIGGAARRLGARRGAGPPGADTVRDGLAALGIHPSSHESHAIPDLDALPAPVRDALRARVRRRHRPHLPGAVPFALLALICVLVIREVPLRTTVTREGWSRRVTR